MHQKRFNLTEKFERKKFATAPSPDLSPGKEEDPSTQRPLHTPTSRGPPLHPDPGYASYAIGFPRLSMYTFITFPKEVMFLPDFVCLFVCVLAR